MAEYYRNSHQYTKLLQVQNDVEFDGRAILGFLHREPIIYHKLYETFLIICGRSGFASATISIDGKPCDIVV
jgi:hypothetical protein